MSTAVGDLPMRDVALIFVDLDPSGCIEYADRGARCLLGLDDDDLGADFACRGLGPDDGAMFRACVGRATGGQSVGGVIFEARVPGPVEGTTQRVRWHLLPRRRRAGRVVGIRLIGSLLEDGDLSAARAAVDLLHELRFTMDATCVVAVTDAKGVITDVNERFCAQSGYSREELLGHTHVLLNSGHHPRAFFARLWRTITAGRVWHGEIRNRRKDGTDYWVHTTIVPLPGPDGTPDRFMAVRTDITGRLQAEEALVQAVARLERANAELVGEQARMLQAEKMSSVGLLAAGVAHEINNPLGGVIACVEALRNDRVTGERRDVYFATVAEGLERMRAIVDALTRYARPMRPSRGAVSPAGLIEDCLQVLRPVLGQRRVQVIAPAPGVGRIDGDQDQLVHALMNVLLNAVDVSPVGGRVVVSVQETADRVGLQVTDQGPGIAPHIADRVCDPFFSTKPEGAGTGLGLSVTQGIVRAHGGVMHFGTGARGGAQVTMWLPVWAGDDEEGDGETEPDGAT